MSQKWETLLLQGILSIVPELTDEAKAVTL
jgi:hypothetical protein